MSKVVKDFPPNYETICEHIPAVRKNKAIVFTYGDTIYSPMFHSLSDHLMAHEEVHVERQKKVGVFAWWNKYLTDIEFRLQEELVAYQAQYKYLMKFYNRSDRRMAVSSIAKDLAGPMYGNIITKKRAIELIMEKSK